MKPLVTFGIIAYRQEQYIAEAVAAAFNQSYSPLEIILSDDCSPDRTFDIMRDMAANYRGSHKVIINRNETNLGLARHGNRLMQMVQGELLVAAAGDDVSLPERTARLVEAWESTGRKATVLHSRVIHINARGEAIAHPMWKEDAEPTGRFIIQPASPAEYVRTLQPGVFGCASAWSSKVSRLFGDLPADVIHEDNASTLRSILLGQMAFVDEPLVKYRVHENNLFNPSCQSGLTLKSIKEDERRLHRIMGSRAVMYRVFCEDLLAARRLGLIAEDEFSKAFAIAKQHERILSLEQAFLASNMMRKLGFWVKLACAGATHRQLRKMLSRLPPAPVLYSLKLLRGWLRSGGQKSFHIC